MELHRLLEDRELASTPLLVLANKIDLQPHISEPDLIRGNTRSCYLACAAVQLSTLRRCCVLWIRAPRPCRLRWSFIELVAFPRVRLCRVMP